MPTKECHAEIKALKIFLSQRFHSSNFRKINKITLFSCRVKILNNEFVFGMARPCYHCSLSLKKWNIRNVYFTDEHGCINKWTNETPKTFSKGNMTMISEWKVIIKQKMEQNTNLERT